MTTYKRTCSQYISAEHSQSTRKMKKKNIKINEKVEYNEIKMMLQEMKKRNTCLSKIIFLYINNFNNVYTLKLE